MKIASYYFLCLLVFLVSCEAIFESKPEISRENWITILNLDGTVDTYLQEGGGSCFFVPNPDEPDDEIALIVNHGKIFTMSLTGVHLNNLFEPDEGYEIDLRSTNLSHDKSKMVLKYGYNLYLIDIVDSSKIQLTFSYENIYGFPSFCLDDQKIIFSKIESDQRFLIEFDLETLTENVVMFNDEIVISRAKFITHDKIIGIAYNYINQEVGNLILYEVDSEEIHQISSEASDLFDINSFNGYL